MRMGARSRAKGKRGEREVVRLALAHGLEAERTWHTAQSTNRTERACDVLIERRHAQVKVAADGFGSLYDSLDGVKLLFVRADRRERLVALRASDYLELLKNKDSIPQEVGKL